MKFHLGVENFSYVVQKQPMLTSVVRVRKKAYGQGKSTGDVATQIENQFKLMETFYDLDGESVIIPIIENIVFDDINTKLEGKSADAKLKDEDAQKVEKQFMQNLSSRRYDGVIKGVPTRPSLKTNRPSFINTGLYSSSFRFWMEE